MVIGYCRVSSREQLTNSEALAQQRARVAPYCDEIIEDIKPRTTATVAWSPPQWVNAGDAGFAQRTPDLSAPLQEVVNRAGFNASSNVQFIFFDNTNNAATRAATSCNTSPINAPTLMVTYL